jgi:hypothetical protein
LKKKVVNGEYLASEFDNLFYDAAVLKINKHDVIPFLKIHLIRKKLAQYQTTFLFDRIFNKIVRLKNRKGKN